MVALLVSRTILCSRSRSALYLCLTPPWVFLLPSSAWHVGVLVAGPCSLGLPFHGALLLPSIHSFCGLSNPSHCVGWSCWGLRRFWFLSPCAVPGFWVGLRSAGPPLHGLFLFTSIHIFCGLLKPSHSVGRFCWCLGPLALGLSTSSSLVCCSRASSLGREVLSHLPGVLWVCCSHTLVAFLGRWSCARSFR